MAREKGRKEGRAWDALMLYLGDYKSCASPGDVPLFFCAQLLPQAGAALHLVCIAIPKFKNP